MTDEELDRARYDEAVRRVGPISWSQELGILIAKLAREEWKPKKPFEDAAREIVRNNPFESEIDHVRRGIEYGRSLPPKPTRSGEAKAIFESVGGIIDANKEIVRSLTRALKGYRSINQFGDRVDLTLMSEESAASAYQTLIDLGVKR